MYMYIYMYIYIYIYIYIIIMHSYPYPSNNSCKREDDIGALLVAYIGAVLDQALDDAGGHLTIATSIQWRCCHHTSVNHGGEFGSFAVGLSHEISHL